MTPIPVLLTRHVDHVFTTIHRNKRSMFVHQYIRVRDRALPETNGIRRFNISAKRDLGSHDLRTGRFYE